MNTQDYRVVFASGGDFIKPIELSIAATCDRAAMRQVRKICEDGFRNKAVCRLTLKSLPGAYIVWNRWGRAFGKIQRY